MTTGRHGQEEGSGGRGGVGRRHKTMDAHLTTLCSSLSEDTLINPCHNILLFCHFSRRGESSWVEPSGEFSVAAAAVADASSFLNLQRNNSKYIRWLTHGQTDTRTAERQTNEQEISLLLTHPDIPPGLVWQAQLSTDYSCAYTPPPLPLGQWLKSCRHAEQHMLPSRRPRCQRLLKLRD